MVVSLGRLVVGAILTLPPTAVLYETVVDLLRSNGELREVRSQETAGVSTNSLPGRKLSRKLSHRKSEGMENPRYIQGQLSRSSSVGNFFEEEPNAKVNREDLLDERVKKIAQGQIGALLEGKVCVSESVEQRIASDKGYVEMGNSQYKIFFDGAWYDIRVLNNADDGVYEEGSNDSFY